MATTAVPTAAMAATMATTATVPAARFSGSGKNHDDQGDTCENFHELQHRYTSDAAPAGGL
jgi:Spy/CpxP family protein refolding chaperone